MPVTNTWSIGSMPSGDWRWDSPPGVRTLIDLDRTHPMLRYVDLLRLLVFDGRAVAGPAGTVDLVRSDAGPILSIAPRDGFQDAVLGFAILTEDEGGSIEANTNWYAERSWPVFVLGVLQHLAGARDSSAAASIRPGTAIRHRVDAGVDKILVRRTIAAGAGAGEDREPRRPGGRSRRPDRSTGPKPKRSACTTFSTPRATGRCSASRSICSTAGRAI